MHPSSGGAARSGAGSDLAGTRVTLIIWCDWKGELYAFCSRECLRRYQGWLCDPNYLYEKATWTDASFGCIWCGGDLTQGTIWLGEEPLADPKVVPPR